MQAVTRKVKAAVRKVVSVVKGLFGRVKSVFVKKAKTSRKRKVAAAPVPAPAPAPAAAPAPAPVAPTAGPQAAGRKMRMRNLKKMKFYKASRKAMRNGKKMSRRR